MNGNAYVTVRSLIKRFGALAAVDNASFAVGAGHTLALLGPSGCGKTTILRCLAGLETPDGGTIELGGRAAFDSAGGVNVLPEQRGLGIVFQSYAVWPHMSVAENVGFPLKVRGVPRAEQRMRVAKILDLVGLSAALDKPATQLSGGQQQRVALARALVHEPRLVLFDEPMSNLDAQLREQVRLEIKVLQERLEFTAIYVTHDQAEAFALAETIIIMNRGAIETIGSPRQVFHRPHTPFVARFLGFNVKEATVAAMGDGASTDYAQIAIHNGPTLWGNHGGDHRIAIGTSVLACIRKEHVGLDGCGAQRAADASAGNMLAQDIAGEIRTSSFLGLTQEHVVGVGGIELRAIESSSASRSGRVDVCIRPDECIILPAAAA